MPGTKFFIAVVATLLMVSCAHNTAPLKVLGVWHNVSSGETVDAVANRYGADADTIAELNDLQRDGEIKGREEIFVPKSGGKAPGTGAPPPSPVVAAQAGSTAGAAIKGQCGSGGRPCYSWPADGKVGSTFGPRDGKHHDGLDLLAERGTTVKAAADGQVLYSGDEIEGYGNLVLVRHDGGIITVYAHNDKNMVKEGDMVEREQKIAEVGDTGSATATHLHFEVRVGERPRDPLLYLPTRE